MSALAAPLWNALRRRISATGIVAVRAGASIARRVPVLSSSSRLLSGKRRTYKSSSEPAADGGFDFVSYFECADADVPVFHEVCDALRDLTRNPEWAFVREGPTWHGRRTATWADLFI